MTAMLRNFTEHIYMHPSATTSWADPGFPIRGRKCLQYLYYFANPGYCSSMWVPDTCFKGGEGSHSSSWDHDKKQGAGKVVLQSLSTYYQEGVSQDLCMSQDFYG